ncbi:MAG: hypoxanthine-guanine phosphoribosyltransferase [Gammaproteobacteria bacterium]|nr:hypoxanthine-guanine phosphoribosyltransferase [Gammaproteobacteria bacterium]|tara:strand:+ start:558 stop:1124 length:567 start_codon:yes stop_codon:yes gene_type:complete
MTRVPDAVLRARESAELMVSAADVEFAVNQTAVRIGACLADENPLVVCVLQGGLNYTAELVRRVHFPLEICYVHVSRYRDRTKGGELEWIAKPRMPLSDRSVLLVDDIFDEGVTLSKLAVWANEQGAHPVRTSVLVEKDVERAVSLTVDFPVLRCPDRYLFGCGMDYRGYWRNLPAIYALPVEMEDSA